MGRDLINVVHAIVYIIYLSAPSQLPMDRLTHHLIIIFHYIGLDRDTVDRRLLQHTHVADADQAHVERSGDRSRRKCQYVHVLLQLLDLFLMGNSESLLLVNDKKSQILKLNILRQDPMSSDHNIHKALLKALQRFFDLSR